MSDRDDDGLVESAKEWLEGLGQSSEPDQDQDGTFEHVKEADDVSIGDLDHPEGRASGDRDDADDPLGYLKRAEPSEPRIEPTSVEPYRSASGLAKVLQVAFVAWMFLGGLAVASSFVEYRLILRLIEDPLSVSLAQVETSSDRQGIIAIVQIVGLLAVGVIFIAWVRRLYRNLPVLGASQRFKPGWAVGAWFVPFLNLWRPKQIVDEIWRGSSPSRSDQVSPLLHWWWGFWIAGAALGQIVFRARDVSSLESARNLALGVATSDVAELVTAGLAFWVVARVTQRQVGYAATVTPHAVEATLPSSTELQYPERVTPKLGWLGALSLPAVGVAVAVVAFLAWDVTESGGNGEDEQSGSNADARSVMATELRVGDCFNNPGITDAQTGPEPVLAVPVVPCEAPHFAEVYAVLEHPGSQSDPFPGEVAITQQALAQCLTGFEGFVGESYDVSPLDIIFINPDVTGWRTGNRQMRCSVYRLDLQNMTGSMRGSGGIAVENYEDAVFAYADFHAVEGLTLTGVAAQADSVLRLTPSWNVSVAGAAWFSDKQPVENGFETSFVFQLSDIPQNPGDGFAFVIQNSDIFALGEASYGIGYTDIRNSVAVEFDTTFQGYSGDVGAQHIGVHTRGTDANTSHESASIGRVAPDVFLADGLPHLVRVEYSPGTLNVFVDAMNVPTLTVSLDLADTLRLDDGKAWVGFTASTEPGFRENHDILSWTFDVAQ